MLPPTQAPWLLLQTPERLQECRAAWRALLSSDPLPLLVQHPTLWDATPVMAERVAVLNEALKTAGIGARLALPRCNGHGLGVKQRGLTVCCA